jgi:K+-sensing histidine kinase KdpD
VFGSKNLGELGKLKIFFGAAGVGKTYAMLEAALAWARKALT